MQKITNSVRTYDEDGYRRRAAALCFQVNDTPDTRVLLVASNLHPGRWVIPGGGVEPGETPRDAALREAFEEAGVQAQAARQLGVVQDGDRQERTFVFELTVTKMLTSWPEHTSNGRRREWFTISEAEECLLKYKPNQVKFLNLRKS